MGIQEIRDRFLMMNGYEADVVEVTETQFGSRCPATCSIDPSTKRKQISVKVGLTDEERTEAIAHELMHLILADKIPPYDDSSHEFFFMINNALHHPTVINTLEQHGIPSRLQFRMKRQNLESLEYIRPYRV